MVHKYLLLCSGNTEILVNSVLILFVAHIDELVFKILTILSPSWVDSMSQQQTTQHPSTFQHQTPQSLLQSSCQLEQPMKPSKSASFPPHRHIPPSLHQGPPPPPEDELKFNDGLECSEATTFS
jgi:hypothetical protein